MWITEMDSEDVWVVKMGTEDVWVQEMGSEDVWVQEMGNSQDVQPRFLLNISSCPLHTLNTKIFRTAVGTQSVY